MPDESSTPPRVVFVIEASHAHAPRRPVEIHARECTSRLVGRLVRHCGIIALALLAGGCETGSRDDTVALAGRVTIDGKPVTLGGIQFMPLEQGRPAFAEVRDGVYAARVPKGRVRAIFSSRRETGRLAQVYSTSIPEVIDVLPPSLRDGVEITVEGDDPSRDFFLSGKTGREDPTQ